MGLEQLNFAGLNKVEVSIARLREHISQARQFHFADSGGVDSTAIFGLLNEAKTPYHAHYYVTGIDPPELMQFLKQNRPDTKWEIPKVGFWKLFQKNGFPTRTTRWCCKLLKESQGKGEYIVTGIRWEESPGKRGKRRWFELCQNATNTYYVNPIIDWTRDEVWEYVYSRRLSTCSLYKEPEIKRIGCILCPMGTAKQAQFQIKRFPKIAANWHRAFERFYDLGWDSVKRWKTAEEMWQWWLSRKGEPKVNDAQCIMFDN